MTHLAFHTVVLVLGVLSMGFQLLASRLLNPHFGSSIIVWAWLIATFLAAFSAGSMVGGWVSNLAEDKRRRALYASTAVALLSLAFTAAVGRRLLEYIEVSCPDMSLALLASCVSLFFLPVTALSSFGPHCVQFLASRGTAPGKASGIVYGVSTLGNIAGVMLTAFALIPSFPVSSLLYGWLGVAVLTLAALVRLLRLEVSAPTMPRAPGALLLALLLTLAGGGLVPSAEAAPAPTASPQDKDYLERYDTLYNSLTVEKRGTMVELRARSRRGDHLESAIDLADPLRLVVAYTRTLYVAHFFQPQPERVLMIGLGGAGFHRLFTLAYPRTLLQSVELDPKVLELTRTRLAFAPTDLTPVALVDGRLFVKRDKTQWDWLFLDAFRGGYVPAHLKTREFYRECAARLSPRGVFVSNLHEGTALFYADLKTISDVFPQVVLFRTAGTGNVIACAVNYRTPAITDPAQWSVPGLTPGAPAPDFRGRLDLAALRAERIDWPTELVREAKLLTDDFAPVEFLQAMKLHNTTEPR